jgi:hypothetical protein
MVNPTLSDLIGGIQAVTLGDDEARRRGTQKTVLERKQPPTFDVLVEIRNWDDVIVYTNVAEAVDALLRGESPSAEQRSRATDGQISIEIVNPEPTEGFWPADKRGGFAAPTTLAWILTRTMIATTADSATDGKGATTVGNVRIPLPPHRLRAARHSPECA